MLQATLLMVLVYLVIVALFGLLQRSLIYHPTRESRITAGDAGLPDGQVHSVTTVTEDGLTLHGWHVLPDGRAAEDREDCDEQLSAAEWVVLFFSGNAANRRARVDEFGVLTGLGAHVVLFDYRGYGENAGSPSADGLAADARAAWKYVTEERDVPAERVILYGESLGGAVAVRLAAELCRSGTSPGGLVMRSTFSSLAETGSRLYPWLPIRWLLLDRYPSARRFPNVHCPILQIHGRQDQIVPLELGRKLFEAAPDESAEGVAKQFVDLPEADHNNLILTSRPAFRRSIARFLERIPSAESDAAPAAER